MSVNLSLSVRHVKGGFSLNATTEVRGNRVTGLIGTSGAGKTTLLRCIAGLDRADQATIHLGDKIWQDQTSFLPTPRRGVGYVFQEASLFAHLSVKKNLLYAIKRAPRATTAGQFDILVARLGLSDLLDRHPDSLSGGQRQRVALGRALLSQPEVLLLDEPMSALDDSSKNELMGYLDVCLAGLEIPVLYISHSMHEIARISDDIVVLERGEVRVSGPTREILTRLDLPFALESEAEAIISAVISAHDPVWGLSYLSSGLGQIAVSEKPAAVGQSVKVRILARDVSIALRRPEATSIQNVFAMVITACMEKEATYVIVRLESSSSESGSENLLARVTRKAFSELNLSVGMRVFAQVKSVALLA